MLTFESSSVLGAGNIVEKLVVCRDSLIINREESTNIVQSLPFQKVKHEIATLDAQPGMGDGSVIILVTGALKVRELNIYSWCCR